MIFRPTPPPGGWSQSWAACLHRIGVNTEVPEGKSALKDGMHRKGGPFRSSRTHKLIGWTRISSFSATTLTVVEPLAKEKKKIRVQPYRL